ncbi:MAG TPA: DoxX family protein [Thermomicrobiaceae bacterium]|nr:DoxX family protein [Thermomicrobiaceae bacterium]
MNTRVIVYWVATTLIALETLIGGVTDLVHGRQVLLVGVPVADIVTNLGYPVYVLTILGLLKIPGAIVVLLPGWPRLKEWAYAGIVFEMAGAAASYVAHDHDAGSAVGILVIAGLALLSWALRPPSRTLGGQILDRRDSPVGAPANLT